MFENMNLAEMKNSLYSNKKIHYTATKNHSGFLAKWDLKSQIYNSSDFYTVPVIYGLEYIFSANTPEFVPQH